MQPFCRRSVLAGLAGALSACAVPDEPVVNADWLLGTWQDGLVTQRLTVTSAAPGTEMAHGSWGGEPVSIIVHGSSLRFVTARGVSVQLVHIADATLVGTIDRAPWLAQSAGIAVVYLQRVA